MTKLRGFWAALAVAFLLLLAGCGGRSLGPPRVRVPYPAPPEPPRYFHERTVHGTGDVEIASGEDKLRALLTGAPAKKGLGFSKPFDVAVHKGRVFVSDTVRRVVFALDFPTGKTFQVGAQGDEGDLGKPLGIAVDGGGNLYVVDARFQRVAVFDRDGKFLTAFGGKDVLNRPAGIDVDREGTRAYVVDVGGVDSEEHRIQVFDPRSGKHLRTIGSRGVGPGRFNLPRDVALGPDGLLYVSDGGNFRVQALNEEGRFVRTWGKAGMRFGQFSRPKGIAVDPEGNVHVVDTAFGNFQIFNQDGQLLLFVGKRSERNGPGVFMLPAGIAVDENGRIYVVDQFYNKLEVFRPVALPPDKGFLAYRVPAE